MVISQTATATMPAAIRTTSRMLPFRRAGPWATKGSVTEGSLLSAVIWRDMARLHHEGDRPATSPLSA
ncbi:hypothetical protein ACVI1L_008200 [Bradyrhizobium sp. USDA 4516]